jgi:SulP family sulfate permease
MHRRTRLRRSCGDAPARSLRSRVSDSRSAVEPCRGRRRVTSGAALRPHRVHRATSTERTRIAETVRREALAALAAGLVAVPAAIANGLVLYGPLGPSAAGAGALAGVVGAAVLGTIAPLLGGTPGLVSAPSPAASAFLALIAAQMLDAGVPAGDVPARLALVAALAGALQVAGGVAGVGRLVKLLPYPVVAGYLTGGGILILDLQLGKLAGAPGRWRALEVLSHPGAWRAPALAVAAATLAAALAAPRLTRKVPATLFALGAGVAVHRALALRWPALAVAGDPAALVVGPVLPVGGPGAAAEAARLARALSSDAVRAALGPAATLAALLAIDTLKTCLLVEARTRSRHAPGRELVGQGVGNLLSAALGGAPGTGIVSGSLVNVGSGGRTRGSGVAAGAFAGAVLLGLGPLLASLPVPALAAIVALMATRMLQLEALRLVRHRATLGDFAVAAAVVVVALSVNLAAAAGVGLALSALLFLRQQVAAPVVRRVAGGAGATGEIRVVELQGHLFFGTADRVALALAPEVTRHRGLVLDLAHVQSVDVTAVRALERVAERLAERGGRLALCGAGSGALATRLRGCLAQTALARGPLRPVVAGTVEDAIASLERPSRDEGSRATG